MSSILLLVVDICCFVYQILFLLFKEFHCVIYCFRVKGAAIQQVLKKNDKLAKVMMNRILQNRYIEECAWNSGFQKHYLQVTDVESYVEKLVGYGGELYDWQKAVASTTFNWYSKIDVVLGVALFWNFMRKLFMKISDIDDSLRSVLT